MKSLKLSFKNIGSKTITSYIASAYLLIMFLVYPFFMPKGYVRIDFYKYNFFLYSSLGAVLLLLLTGLVELIKEIGKIVLTDIFILVFIIVSVISFLISQYRETAFLGADGWYMGFLSLIIISFLYIFISRLWEYEGFVLHALLLGAFAVFGLGFFDRFSLYIIPLEIRDPGFVSTTGNINWFMGFYSVFSTIGTVTFLKYSDEGDGKVSSRIKDIALKIFVLMSFLVGLVQGAESVFLYWAVLLFVVLILSYRGIVPVKKVLMLIAAWSISGIVIGLMCRFMPGSYNYDCSNLGYRISNGALPFYVLSISIILLYTVSYLKNSKVDKIVSGVLSGLMVLGGLFVLVIGIIKTNTDLIQGFEYSLFYFDDRFGSGRGFAYRTSMELIKRMSVKDIFFGVGPDCFANYAYSFEDIASSLRSVWPGEFLPNAHCEILSMFINEGILGVFSYLGIFVSFLIAVRKKLDDSFILAVFITVICYLGHNLVSFAQVLNTPYIFILMGMAVAKNGETL